ncbi:MAG: hypothetical protein NDJ89_14920 [Oligoflexia bacterium]|nr:hypothetical protein [Oligoflexia bacterium]
MKLSTTFLTLPFAFSLTLGLLSQAGATQTGFEGGNEFEAIAIEGTLAIRCHQGSESDFAIFDCRSEILEPGEYARFVTEPGGAADRVILTATRENGSIRTKSDRFDAAKGQSEGHFNLWISSLLQRPLLNYGANRIHYSLKRDKVEERSGDFIVNVKRGPTRVCARGSMTSFRLDDCRIPGFACSQYFERENYCSY